MKKMVCVLCALCFVLCACDEGSAESEKNSGQLKSLPFLVVDLDGDGFEYIPLDESEVYFDVDGDGFAERTEWVHPDDGFVLLFSQEERELSSNIEKLLAFSTNGLLKVKNYDRDKNGLFSEDDKVLYLGTLAFPLGGQLWLDKDKNGTPVKGEYSSFLHGDSFQISYQGEKHIRFGGKTYSIEERSFSYEDSNVRWDEMCKRLRNNYFNSDGSKRDYDQYCKQKEQ